MDIQKLKSADVIAILVICGYLFLSWRGVATDISSAFLLVIGYYFGHSASTNSNDYA